MAPVARGMVDAAAIDSNVLATARRRDPGLERELRVLESWGPFPIQPVIVRAGLYGWVKRRLLHALLGVGDGLAQRGLAGFAPVSDAEPTTGRPGRVILRDRAAGGVSVRFALVSLEGVHGE